MKSFRNLLILSCMLFLVAGMVMAAGGAQQQPARPAGPVTIEFMYCIGGSAQVATLALVERFNALHSGNIIVEATYGGSYVEAIRRQLAAIVAGDPPVIMHQAMTYSAGFIHEGHLEGLNAYFRRDNSVNETDFVEGLFNLYRWENEIWGVPYNVSNPIIYYNKDLFRQAGLDPEKPPVTWDEFYEYTKRIAALDPGNIYGASLDLGTGWLVQAYSWQWGGDWIARDNSRVVWTDDASMNAARFMRRMIDEGVAIIGGGGPMNLGGRVGMWIASTANLVNNMTGANFDMGAAVLPYAVQKKVPIGGGGLYMTRVPNQYQKDAGWELLKFLSNAESQYFWAESTGYQASSVGAVNSPQMRELWARDPRYAVTYEQIPYAVAENDTMLIPFNEARDLHNEAWNAVLRAGADPLTVFTDAQNRANRILEEYRR